VAQFSPEELAITNMLVGAASMCLQNKPWPSFEDWLDHLAHCDPYQMVDEELDHLVKYAKELYADEPDAAPSRQQLAGDRATYLHFVEQMCDFKGMDCDHPGLADLSFDLLQDPPARLARIVDRVTMLWEDHLAGEWERHLPALQDSVAAFQSLDLDGLTTAEAIRRIIGRDEPQVWGNWRDNLREIIFIPSAHIGPYLLMIDHDDTTARIVFGARIPEGATVQSPALNRSDLLVRLSALADDTRLRILHLIALEGEQDTKRIMDQLDLSKSAASRHLRQLTASGYLTVRQQDVSKFYQLNPDRIDGTWHALKTLLRLS
jgi:DNA-binding transcriptional ArsR family regulator